MMEFESELLEGAPIPVIDRYYTKYFALGSSCNGIIVTVTLSDMKERVSEDHCILRHTNR